jgi:beta-N-acetylhexosaminidase
LIATAKHFPGHGDTFVDSHHEPPTISHSIDRLRDVELKPFRAAVEAGGQAIMTAHIIFPALDADNPATISTRILRGVLRDQMGFEGLIVTDAMDMHAIARLGTEESIQAALDAGVDLILLGHIREQVRLTETFRSRFDPDSVARIRKVQAGLPTDLPDLSVIGCDEHKQIARQIAERSITLVRDQRGQLPLNLDAEQTIGVIHVQPSDLTPADTSSRVAVKLGEAVRARHARTVEHTLPYRGTSDDVRAALDAVADADVVIAGTIQANHDSTQVELVRALQSRGQHPIVAALRLPYDIVAFPEIETYLCTYGIRPVTMEALVRVLFGEIHPTGVLPCQIPGIAQHAASSE